MMTDAFWGLTFALPNVLHYSPPRQALLSKAKQSFPSDIQYLRPEISARDEGTRVRHDILFCLIS